MYKIRYKKKSSLELAIPSLTERYKQLLQSDKTQVLYVKQVFDNSTFRYRAYNVQQALETSKTYTAHYFLIDEIPKILPALQQLNIGAVVFQRSFWDDNVQTLLDWCDTYDKPAVFDMDDFIFEPNCLSELFYAMGWDADRQDGVMLKELAKQAALHYMIASRCQYFISTNQFLAYKIEAFFGKQAFIIPNFINHEQEVSSADAVSKKQTTDGNFTIGYFSGSESHRNDFQTISSELATVLSNNANINLKIVGFMGLPADLGAFKDRIIFTPFVSYIDLQYEVASVDVNIVPLFASTFTDCKSDLKYFEAAIVKTPTIASPSFAYRQSIQHGINGLLCKQGEWIQAIELLVRDRELSGKLAEAAFLDSGNYKAATQQAAIEQVFAQIIKRV